jgi:hypothetical protein
VTHEQKVAQQRRDSYHKSNALTKLFIGAPIESEHQDHARLPKWVALPVFASDALSSNAYSTQEILLVLSLGGFALYAFAPWVAVLVILVFFVVKDNPDAVISKAQRAANKLAANSTLLKDLMLLLRMPQIWLVAGVIMVGQGLFFLTYSISAYLQVNLGLTALAAGSITLSKLWMRPLGGFTIGFLGDWFSREVVMAWLMLFASFSLLAMIFLPLGGHVYLILPLVLVIGYITYAIKGLYWSLLDYCPVPPHLTGLAIGLVI